MSDKKEKLFTALSAVKNDTEKVEIQTCGTEDFGCTCGCGNPNSDHDGCCWFPDAGGDDSNCWEGDCW